MTIEENNICAEQCTKTLVGIVMALKTELPDKHEIAAMKSGDAIYEYQERVKKVQHIGKICNCRLEAMTDSDCEKYKRFPEFENACSLWDMLNDIHRFVGLFDMKFLMSFAFYVEYITLRIFESQAMKEHVYSEFVNQ